MSILRDTPTPYMTFIEQATAPATPASGKQLIYPKTDGKWYVKDDAGNEVCLGSNSDVMTTKGDLLTRNGSTYVRLGVGTDGQVLTADAAEDAGMKWATPEAGGSSLLSEQVITGSAVTQIDFAGLDINTHKSYRVEIDLVNPTSTALDLNMCTNDDTTLGNYYSQNLYGDGSNHGSSRVNTPRCLTMAGNSIAQSTLNLRILGGYIRATAEGCYGPANSIVRYEYALGKTATITNLTKLSFISTVAGGIGIGSKVRLYRGDV